MSTPSELSTLRLLEQRRGVNPNLNWTPPVPRQTPIPQPAASTPLMPNRVSYGGVSQAPAQQVASRVFQPSSQRSRHHSLHTGQIAGSEHKSPGHSRDATPMPRPVPLSPTMRASHPRNPNPPAAPIREDIG